MREDAGTTAHHKVAEGDADADADDELVAEDIDVVKIYSAPRATKRVEQWGLKGGGGLDLTTKDSDGKALGFSKSTMRKRAVKKINKDKPLLIADSPMFTDWSAMMNLTWTVCRQKKRRGACAKHASI